MANQKEITAALHQSPRSLVPGFEATFISYGGSPNVEADDVYQSTTIIEAMTIIAGESPFLVDARRENLEANAILRQTIPESQEESDMDGQRCHLSERHIDRSLRESLNIVEAANGKIIKRISSIWKTGAHALFALATLFSVCYYKYLSEYMKVRAEATKYDPKETDDMKKCLEKKKNQIRDAWLSHDNAQDNAKRQHAREEAQRLEAEERDLEQQIADGGTSRLTIVLTQAFGTCCGESHGRSQKGLIAKVACKDMKLVLRFNKTGPKTFKTVLYSAFPTHQGMTEFSETSNEDIANTIIARTGLIAVIYPISQQLPSKSNLQWQIYRSPFISETQTVCKSNQSKVYQAAQLLHRDALACSETSPGLKASAIEIINQQINPACVSTHEVFLENARAVFTRHPPKVTKEAMFAMLKIAVGEWGHTSPLRVFREMEIMDPGMLSRHGLHEGMISSGASLVDLSAVAGHHSSFSGFPNSFMASMIGELPSGSRPSSLKLGNMSDEKVPHKQGDQKWKVLEKLETPKAATNIPNIPPKNIQPGSVYSGKKKQPPFYPSGSVGSTKTRNKNATGGGASKTSPKDKGTGSMKTSGGGSPTSSDKAGGGSMKKGNENPKSFEETKGPKGKGEPTNLKLDDTASVGTEEENLTPVGSTTMSKSKKKKLKQERLQLTWVAKKNSEQLDEIGDCPLHSMISSPDCPECQRIDRAIANMDVAEPSIESSTVVNEDSQTAGQSKGTQMEPPPAKKDHKKGQ